MQEQGSAPCCQSLIFQQLAAAVYAVTLNLKSTADRFLAEQAAHAGGQWQMHWLLWCVTLCFCTFTSILEETEVLLKYSNCAH